MGKKITADSVVMEHKTIGFQVLSVDGEGRTLEGYGAAFGNIDEVGDIIHPGAFAKTITERGNKVKLLWQHQSDEPLGKITELREDAKGLYFKALISDTRRGRDALALIKDEAIGEMSIGYDAMEKGTDYSETADGASVRNLREVRLWEISLVSFPANSEAQVLALKAREEKVGRVLSKRNAEEIRSALGALTAVLKRAGVMDEDLPEEDEEEEPEKSEKSPPWHIEEQEGEFCVIVDEDDSVVKCYSTEAEAVAHMRALYANVEEAEKAGKSPTEAGPSETPTSEKLAEIARLEIELLEV